MSDSIYKAPDVRVQTLEDCEQFINTKRAQRLVLAEKYKQTQAEKAGKLADKALSKFEKQAALFVKAQEKLTDQIDKMEARLAVLNDIHSELINLEGVMNETA